MTIRKDSSQVSLPNDGLVVFLYDDSYCQALIESKAPILTGYHPGEGFGKPELAREGMLAAYVLAKDDDVSIEVNIGPPLTEEELSFPRWLAPQHSFLRLPTGRLALESYSSLRPGPEYPMERGAILKVPPGDYLVTLNRVDWDASERAGVRRASVPDEVITLTPLQGDDPPEDAAGLMEFSLPKDTSWVGDYRIKDGIFHGRIVFNDFMDSFLINLDEDAAGTLNWEAGTELTISAEPAGIEINAVLVDLHDAGSVNVLRDRIQTVKKSSPEFATGWWASHQDSAKKIIAFVRGRARKPIGVRHQRRWIPAVISPKTE